MLLTLYDSFLGSLTHYEKNFNCFVNIFLIPLTLKYRSNKYWKIHKLYSNYTGPAAHAGRQECFFVFIKFTTYIDTLNAN